jgi:excisionase family DNA binding protein
MPRPSQRVSPEASPALPTPSSASHLAEDIPSALAYTDAEVSSLLRVSKRTVYRLRKSGVLRAVYIGRAVRTPAEQVLALLSVEVLKTKQEWKENKNAGQSPRIQPQR